MKKLKFISAFLIISAVVLNLNGEEAVNLSTSPSQHSAIEAMSNPNYLVTIGDVYELGYLAGAKAVTYKIVVDASYNVRVANLTIINARGLTFLQLKRQIENIIVKNYPMSGVQFIMVSLGAFTVAVRGEVKTAFEASVTGLVRLSNVIKSGVTDYSSIRDIEILSVAGTKKKYDLFKAKRYGDFSQDPFLRPGDTVIVNRVKRSVIIDGGIERPGKYQLLDGEGLKELIEIYGGGLVEFANENKVTVKHNSKSTEFPLGQSVTLEKEEEWASFELKNYDSVYVENSASLKGLVYFEGSLNSAEKVVPVQFTMGDDLVSVIRERRTLFSSMSDTKNAYLMRKGQKIYENFNRIFYDTEYSEKILLEHEDRIVVPFLQQVVIVAGAVVKPGSYPYSPGKSFEYYVSLSGGFDVTRNVGSAVVITDASGKKMKKTDDILPDTVITAKSNSFVYNFSRYAPVVSIIATVLSIVTSVIALTRNR